jgi:hypothetical protein
MRTIVPNLACCLVALGLMALTPSAGLAEPARGPLVVAQASEGDDDGEDVPPRRGAADEPEAADDGGAAMTPPAGSGFSSRPDLFDADEPRGVARAPDRGEVVCIAGCDGPRGGIVYKPRS